MLSVLIAPLFTISTSMQLSLGYNAVSMQEFKKTDPVSRKTQSRLGESATSTTERSLRGGFMDKLKGSGS